MQESASDNPLRHLYREIQRAARQAREPHIHQSNQATGTGKTYQALMTSVEALRQAKAAGESLIVVYVAPQHRHIPLENRTGRHPAGSPQALLASAGIPAVKVNSYTLLTDPGEAHNLYQALIECEQRLGGRRKKPALGLARCLEVLLYRHQASQKNAQALPENALEMILGRISRQQSMLLRLRREGVSEADLKGSLEKLRDAHEQLFSTMQRAVDIALKQSTLDGQSLESVLGQAALVAPFRFFQRQLFPWYEVVRRPGGPLGMVAMTASRLMTRHVFPRPRKDAQSAEKGDFTVQSCYLEDAIHGTGAGSDMMGLNEGRTRFLLLLDESDAVKQDLGQPAVAGEIATRRHLGGMLLDQARATQIGNTLLNEMPLVFCSAQRRDAVWQDYKALVDAHPSLFHRLWAATPADMDKLRSLPPEAETALRRHQRHHRLGTASPAHHRQQLLLRDRLTALLGSQQRHRPAAGDSRDEKLAQFVSCLKAFCQRVSWVNLNLGDATVAAAGSTGTFTAGSWSFVNLKDERLAGLLAHRDSVDVNEVDIVSEAFLRRAGGQPGDTSFALAESFELMLTLAGLVHLMAGTEDSHVFSLLVDPYRGHDNRTSSAPLTDMLRRLSGVRMHELMAARRDIEPDQVIDDDVAFRYSHLIMQWVPDFERRFIPGAPGESVVPAIGFRAWSAEHQLERLVSPDACAFNRPETADNASARRRPAHSLVLISATGGFAATHLGGFAGDMLAHSRFVRYVPMSDRALELARQARELRHRGQGDTPGRPLPDVARLPEYGGLLAEDARGPLLAELDDALAPVTSSPFKRREVRRVVELVTLLGYSPRRLTPDTTLTPELYQALPPALVESAAPCMALMLIQSLKNSMEVLKRLEGRRLTSIIDGHLYGYDTGRNDGSRPVLLITYYSGRQSGTDARIQQMLCGEGSDGQQQRQAFTRFVQQRSPEVSLARVFPAEDAAGTSQRYTATDLLRRDLGYHAAVITAFQSAGLGHNFKVDTHLGRDGERDVDMLVLGMSPHFTAARPRFERYQGPPGEGEPDDTQEERDKRGEKNRRAFLHNNRMVHGFALAGMELAARLNQQRWGRPRDTPSRQYRVRDIRLHPDSYLAPFPAFLREQHAVDLARMVFQAAGRGERTPAAQPQALLACEEVVAGLVAADPFLYADDGRGGLRAAQQHAASLNSLALMRYARCYRRFVYDYPAEDELDAAVARLDKVHHAFSDNPAVQGFKNRLLQGIRQMQAGVLDASQAAALIDQWEAWRSPALLFPQGRQVYRDQAVAAGVPEDVLELMWWPLRHGRRLPIYKGGNGYEGMALAPPDETRADDAVPYPRDTSQYGFRLPSGMFQRLQRQGMVQPEWQAATLRDRDSQRVLHPILEPDASGIWGELLLDGWFADVQAELPGIQRLDGVAVQHIYELFDRYWRWHTASGEEVLVALDAKHYARTTDRRLGNAVHNDAQGKQAAVRRWAREQGYARVVMAYVNTRPCPQEEARAGICQAGLVSFSAFVRTQPTDINAPRDVALSEHSAEAHASMESPLLGANPVATERLIAAVQGDTP